MLARTLALICACTLGFTAGAAAQTPAAPPATTAPAGTPPAAMPPATAPAAAPTTAAPQANTAPAAAAVPATPPTRIRGTIAAVAPHMLTVNSRDGSKLEIALADPLTVRTLKRVPLSSVANGAYLGIASREGPNGTRVALEVLVFPEALRGAGAGNYGWDLQPGSMMTNAPVTGVASQKSGRDLTLTYQGGSVTIHVPPTAPVVTFVPATAADLKPGRKVFLAAKKDADGHFSTGAVTVGTHGVNPPM
ncbi:MAG TPA: hypothetical protein VK741_10740 [Acetobacteraceae bacterium]|jgi:hypothetical protein|nr:hypothetical protein [Acetobacteraceae bacterium]